MVGAAGYRGLSLAFLRRARVAEGDVVEARLHWGVVKGTIIPRYQNQDDSFIVLKLPSGYNLGIHLKKIKSLKKLASGEKPKFARQPLPKPKKGLPLVAILGTGGTIASRVDYRTGAVHPAISANDLYALVPELSEIARIEPQILFNIYSEDIEPMHWTKLAERVAAAVRNRARGVVITHGTDTMGYTAAALSFALQGVPVPVVLVGSQRSSDRPSSDAVLNLIGAVYVAANAEFSGVYVAMHSGIDDDKISFHLGTRVRKNHSSSRDAFQSIGLEPVAYWSSSGLEVARADLPRRTPTKNFRPRIRFDGRVSLIKSHPALSQSLLGSLNRSGMRAIIIEGTGLGHIANKCIPTIRNFIERGGFVGMTTQCIWGRVNMNVYNTGRDLLRIGVVPLEDMLAETAFAKAMWVFANFRSTKLVSTLMKSNLAGEIDDVTYPRSFQRS
jgi:glutamyl-tRNA(Gln) amidotransferase subunit D